MVFTNFELWAADGSSGSSVPSEPVTNNLNARNLNPFDPRAVPQTNSNVNHLSSNGYYGFAYVNAAHDVEINNNIGNINNNNNNTTSNLMANDVNGIMNNTSCSTTNMQQSHESSVNFDNSADVSGHINVARCKKRLFVVNKDNDVYGNVEANNKNDCSDNYEVSAKRCRLDDYSAEYFNDFFQLPSTQIGTQPCLMDTEEGQQTLQRQQQVDVAMFENPNNNLEKIQKIMNLQILSAEHQQHNSQQELKSPQQQEQEAQQIQLNHQQQHYQAIQFATMKCHLNYNSNCDPLASYIHACKIDFENLLRIYNSFHSIQSKKANNDGNDNVVANVSYVDDATLFAQLHGRWLRHIVYYGRIYSLSKGNDFAVKDAIKNKNSKDDNEDNEEL